MRHTSLLLASGLIMSACGTPAPSSNYVDATTPAPEAAPKPATTPATTIGASPVNETDPSTADEPALQETGDGFVFVWLRTGPATLSPEDSKAAFDGHFANMDRMAREGSLLVAGPLGDPRAEPDHRGIFIFDAPDVAGARELTKTDPAVVAGVFVFDAEPFRTEAPLRKLTRLEADAERDGVSGMRSYVIATCADVDAAGKAIESLVAEGLVFLSGELESNGVARALCVLDAEVVDDAREMLDYAGGGSDPGWIVSPWYGSKLIAQLPKLAR
jgi:uncharacterized protein YciI